MDIVFEFIDGNAKMTMRLTDDGLQIRRPNKGSEKLSELAAGFLDMELIGDETELAKAVDFVDQAKDISVVIGEERCG